MEQYAKYLRKSRFDRDYAELSVEETLKRHEAILDRLAKERGYYYFSIEDKFGSNLIPRHERDKNGRDYVIVEVPVIVGDQFFAWVFEMRNKITIVGPDSVREQFQKMIQEVGSRYRAHGNWEDF